MTPVLTLESKLIELDLLLDRIGRKLQLNPSSYDQAKERYITIGKFLRAEGRLAKYKPWIFPQGSLRIGTTVKPRGRDEFDLDLVCLLLANYNDFPDPVVLLDLVEERFSSSEVYKNMFERKNRCIRINYANQFHMDILPACPVHGLGPYGEHCVVVPDCALKDWKHSNPKGYAHWFETTAEAAVAKLRRNIEPMPAQEAYDDLATLKRAVQLIKRFRDISLADLPENRRPVSIVITTLAALNYRGASSVTDTVTEVLTGVANMIEWSGSQRLVVKNPTNENEDLSERWDNDPEAYSIFVGWIRDFRKKWVALAEKRGIHNIKEDLEKMFGERIAREVIEERVLEIDVQRRNGTLAVQKGSGIIVPASVTSSVPIRTNTFFGRK
jgi:hypothetical protein